MPEVRCPTGSDENWLRVDDERGEERAGRSRWRILVEEGERGESEDRFEAQRVIFIFFGIFYQGFQRLV